MTNIQPTFARRRFLSLGAGLALSGAFAGAARGQYIATALTAPVKTSNGPVVGRVEDGVHTFPGLRYGAPPVGPLRFMPPQKPDPWTAPQAALRLGNPAMQISAGGSAVAYPGGVGADLDQGLSSGDDLQRQHEDCLFINLWSPGLDARKRPVMVWLHGGGYSYGSGNWPFYNGHNLAKNHDVVVVTVNHRLNVFGYLNLADLGGHPASGNVGMLDIVQVLQWVRDNIAEFGGDPGCVTIFGQSGGGGKVSILQAMPDAKGLFHRAIIESGASLRAGPKDAATAQARKLMEACGVTDVKGLQALSADQLREAAMKARVGGGPILDGVAIPAHPFDPVANPLSASVPVMVGCTADEQTLYNVGFDWFGKLTDEELAAKLKGQYGDKADALLAAARKRFPKDSPSYLYTDITSRGALVGVEALAERKSTQPGGAWAYVWEWGAPAEHGLLRAPHTMEIPFAFDNVDKGPLLLGRDPATFALGHMASTVWTTFARTGDPNVRGLPAWPKYNGASRPTMIFNTQSRVEQDPYGELMATMRTVPPRGPLG